MHPSGPSSRRSRRAFIASSLTVATAAAVAPSVTAASGSRLTFRQSASATPGASPEVELKPWEPRLSGEATIRRFGFGTDNVTAAVRTEAFQKAYPDVKLDVTPEVTDQKILTAVASGDVPDLLWVGTDTVQSWAGRNALEPLDELIAADDRFDVSQIYETQVAKTKLNDATYGVPQFVDCRPLWINHQPLEEAGIAVDAIDTSNWDGLKEQSVALMKKDGDQISRWGLDTKAADFFWMWSWANGGSLLSDDGLQATFATPENIEALQYNMDVYQAQGGYPSFQAFIQTTGFDGADNFFVKNQVAVTPFENWLLGIVAQGDPKHQFTVAPFKGKDGNIVNITGGMSWAIPKGAKNKEAAWEWISFFSHPSVWMETSTAIKQKLDGESKFYTPALTANQVVNPMLTSQVFKPTGNASIDNAVSVFPQILEGTTRAAASPVLKEINDIIMNTVVKPALNGETGVEDALKAGQDKAQKALDDFHK